ncbi:MAG: thioredoxin domain-containing protein [Patescibacteria group bacterium]
MNNIEENTHEEVQEIKKEIQHIREINLSTSIIIASIVVAGAVLMGFSWVKNGPTPSKIIDTAKVLPSNNLNEEDLLPPLSSNDKILGNGNAEITVIEYADFQCPFCGRFHKDAEATILNNYVKNGSVSFVYRDFAFLGDESVKSAEAARCADEQGKFWEYHDYLFTHQKGENQGHFSNTNLKSFASELGLNSTAFNKCLDSDKYQQIVIDETNAGSQAGVEGTPKSFILKEGKVVDTIDGAEPSSSVINKLDKILR